MQQLLLLSRQPGPSTRSVAPPALTKQDADVVLYLGYRGLSVAGPALYGAMRHKGGGPEGRADPDFPKNKHVLGTPARQRLSGFCFGVLIQVVLGTALLAPCAVIIVPLQQGAGKIGCASVGVS